MTEEEQLAAMLGAFVGASLVFGPVFTWLLTNS